eukprot:1156449-Pelagomonas_calceolata.AAC.4
MMKRRPWGNVAQLLPACPTCFSETSAFTAQALIRKQQILTRNCSVYQSMLERSLLSFGHGPVSCLQCVSVMCVGHVFVHLSFVVRSFMDTRDVLVVSPTSDGTSVDLVEDASNARLDAWFQKHGSHKLIIATGFIAKNVEVRWVGSLCRLEGGAVGLDDLQDGEEEWLLALDSIAQGKMLLQKQSQTRTQH